MNDFIVSPAASRDLDEIWEYIAEDSFDAADRWLDKLEKAIQLLAEMPAIGHIREDLTDKPVRFWPVGRYLIIYRGKQKPIEIVRVVSAYRDVTALL
ncbi:MAG: type II toxin-antitoxin system RelE/ParE family toxin [bacterium]|nr:type II toxin-antitoxin system RelE/ParE family toxin [bacterium]